MNVKDLILEAQTQATNAANAYLDKLGQDQFPCGFAWVNIKPARGPVVKALKEMGIGRTDSYCGGYTVWNPSGNFCQNVDAKLAGARAFAKVLNDAGVKCIAESRWD